MNQSIPNPVVSSGIPNPSVVPGSVLPTGSALAGTQSVPMVPPTTVSVPPIPGSLTQPMMTSVPGQPPIPNASLVQTRVMVPPTTVSVPPQTTFNTTSVMPTASVGTTSIMPPAGGFGTASVLPPQGNPTPTIKTLPPKVQKNQLPPQYKTVTLPVKVVTTRLPPIGPLPTPPVNQLNIQMPPVPGTASIVPPTQSTFQSVGFPTNSVDVPQTTMMPTTSVPVGMPLGSTAVQSTVPGINYGTGSVGLGNASAVKL